MEIAPARFTKRDGVTLQEDFFCTYLICKADNLQRDVGLQEGFEALEENESVNQVAAEKEFVDNIVETVGEDKADASDNKTVEIEFGAISVEIVEDVESIDTVYAENEKAVEEGCAIKVSGLCQISFEGIRNPLELEPEDFVDLNNEKGSLEILQKTENIAAATTTVFESELHSKIPIEDDDDTSFYAAGTMEEVSALEDSEINRKVDCAIANDASMEQVVSQKENLEREKYDHGDSAIACSRDDDRHFHLETQENTSEQRLPPRVTFGIDVAVGDSQPIDLLVDCAVGTSQPMYEDSCTNTSQEYVLKSSTANIYAVVDDHSVTTPEKGQHHSGYEKPLKRRKILGEIGMYSMDRSVPDSQMSSSKSTGGRDFKGQSQYKPSHEENTENTEPQFECEGSSYPKVNKLTRPFLRIGLSRNARIPPLLSSINRNNLNKP